MSSIQLENTLTEDVAGTAAAVRKNLAAAPPLTRAQINELHAVLGGAR